MTTRLEKVIYSLVRVLPNQLSHALQTSNQRYARNGKEYICVQLYLGHDGLAVFSLDVAEWHLGALMLVDFQLRMVDVRNVLQRDCSQVSFLRGQFPWRYRRGIKRSNPNTDSVAGSPSVSPARLCRWSSGRDQVGVPGSLSSSTRRCDLVTFNIHSRSIFTHSTPCFENYLVGDHRLFSSHSLESSQTTYRTRVSIPPRIPPNRNVPNSWASSGDRSFSAAGSSRQTVFLVAA